MIKVPNLIRGIMVLMLNCLWSIMDQVENLIWVIMALIAQNMKFSIKDFFSKYNQIGSLLKKSLMENFIFCAVSGAESQ